MDKIIDKDADAIEAIWNQYHATVKDGFVSGVMTSTFYKSLLDRAKLYPIFILPLPRHTGFEFFFMQFHGHQVYFTSLLELQSKQENARPLLVLSHYTELSESKGIVLMSGEIDTSSSLLSVREAQNLVYQLQLFYATGGAAKLNLVEKFNKKPSDFDYQELLEEIEKLG